MGFIIGILPLLQACSALITIWGFVNVAPTTEAVVTYGVYGDAAPDAMSWVNSYGSIAIGIIGMIASKWFARSSGAQGELMVAGIAWIKAPNDNAAIRRLAFAVVDWMEAMYIASHPTMPAAEKVEWDNTIAWLRTKFATPVNPVVPVTPPTAT